MLPDYSDIIERAGEPDWYDENGAPRYGEFRPGAVGIYNDYYAVFVIACQACKKLMRIGYAYSAVGSRMRYREAFGGPPTGSINGDDEEAFRTWYEEASNAPDPSEWGFGDPPRHGCVGDTMGSIELACEQFWYKDRGEHWGERRDPSKEGPLPDIPEGFDDLFTMPNDEPDHSRMF